MTKMPKKISQRELDQILEIIQEGGEEGLSANELESRLGSAIKKRTLQRRLEKLADEIERIGPRSRRRYRLRVERKSRKIGEELGLDGEDGIPISKMGEKIRSEIRKPIHQRKPVSYNLSFFTEYNPNESRYLSEEVTKELLKMGEIPHGKLPTGSYTRKIYDRLLIDLSWSSSRLEGNTYSLLETERLISHGEVAEGKNAKEAQMILNHKAAIELLVEKSPDVGINKLTILNLHALLSDNLLSNSADCGRLRTAPVGIGGTQYVPLDIPQQIEEVFIGILEKAVRIRDPFERSFFLMVHLPYLQPFMDVNKRVSRLVANLPLFQASLCPLSFNEVPQQAYVDGILGVYEFNRIELLKDVYIWAYKQSCLRYAAIGQSLGEPDPFRLKYRTVMIKTVGEIVRQCMGKSGAITYVEEQSVEIPVSDRDAFRDAVVSELNTLHEGNFARYQLRPSEYESWRSSWHGDS
jgi:uncharacterized protein YkvS